MSPARSHGGRADFGLEMMETMTELGKESVR
jgi:hypothetical protein